MSNTKSAFRMRPKPREVLLVRIDENCWCYLVMLSFCRGWLLDFFTVFPTRNLKYFQRSSFKLPLSLGGRFPASFATVAELELTEEELLGPATVYKLTPDSPEFHEASSPYKLIKWNAKGYVTEEEAKEMFRYIDLDLEKGELQTFIRNMLPELRRIEVPAADRWTPPKVTPASPAPDDRPVIVEVLFSCQPEDMGMEADEIAEELGADLEVNDLGSMMTMDSAGEDSEFEIILEVEPRRMKGAISQIRKTLKRLKAPLTTRIIEVADSGNIEHPLTAPPKDK